MLAAPSATVRADLGLCASLFSWTVLLVVPLAVEFSRLAAGTTLPLETGLVAEGAFLFAGLLVLVRLESLGPSLVFVVVEAPRLSDFMAPGAGLVFSEEGRWPLGAFSARKVGGLSHGDDDPEGHFENFC